VAARQSAREVLTHTGHPPIEPTLLPRDPTDPLHSGGSSRYDLSLGRIIPLETSGPMEIF
jgi:hypothetical protein